MHRDYGNGVRGLGHGITDYLACGVGFSPGVTTETKTEDPEGIEGGVGPAKVFLENFSGA